MDKIDLHSLNEQADIIKHFVDDLNRTTNHLVGMLDAYEFAIFDDKIHEAKVAIGALYFNLDIICGIVNMMPTQARSIYFDHLGIKKTKIDIPILEEKDGM